MIERLSEFLRKRRVNLDSFSVVFDIGSRDGRQAVELARLFPEAKVVAIECNPDTLDICQRNIALQSQVKLIPKAINSYTGRCPFYAIDRDQTVTAWKDGNPGASSLFLAAADYPPEKYVQKKIEVDCVRLDDLCRQLGINNIDLIWIDLQGAELLAFQSAGPLLDRVRYIYTEVSFRPIYKGQCLFDDVDTFLTARGFKRCTEIIPERWQQDLIYENTREFTDVIVPFSSRDHKITSFSIRSAQVFVRDVRQVYVVASADPGIDGTHFVPEQFFPFSRDSIRQMLDGHGAPDFYMQQLVNLYFPLVYRSALENVLALDPRTLFLQPCRFIQQGIPLLNFGDEYHAPHFNHMSRLHPHLHRMFAYSGITYCNLLKRPWLYELHSAVEAQRGKTPFWQCYLAALDESDLENGASDAEIYFNYSLRYHAGDVMIRRLRWKVAATLDDVQPEHLEYVALHRGSFRDSAELGRLEELAFSTRRAPSGPTGVKPSEPSPSTADDWALRAGRLFDGKRFADAAQASDRALALDPHHLLAMRNGIHARLHSCDWRRRTEDKQCITAALDGGRNIIASVFHRAICDSESEGLMLARMRSRDFPVTDKPLWNGGIYSHEKIRIAYICSDFREHVVARVIVGCFDHHDKTRFHTTAVSLGPDDGSEMRVRITRAFDRFIDAQRINDAEVAAMLRDLEIDIAIDLNGYSGKRRTGIIARRVAPVQVNYLGYPGTMGASFIDYIIADSIVIPPEHRVHFSEKVAYLPHTYMPVDRQRSTALPIQSRYELGLPEAGFVFASFNYIYKISPEVFDIWLRLLLKIEGSVLWLRSDNSDAMRNLRREAASKGVAPDRIIFAAFVPKPEDHLGRLRVADLFLDTLPYNAHATACDALWAGLPLLTCMGATFQGRVGASVLRAIGLPELVTSSLADYEDQAVRLARNPELLAAIRTKLLRNRETEPLFDTARFTRALEAAYITMWTRHRSGLPPEHFTISSECELTSAC